MADFYTDQAEGLRRLMGGLSFQVIAFGQGEEKLGQSTVIANVALHLARLGRNVLIVDEHNNEGISHYFGKPNTRVLQSLTTHVRLLRVEGNFIQTPDFKRLLNINPPIDTILIDGATAHVSFWMLRADSVIVLVNANAQSVSNAYQMIKVLAENKMQSLYLFVNLVKNAKQAHFAFEKLSQTLLKREIAHLYFAGFLPFDAQIKTSAHTGKPFLKHYPQSSCAQIFYNLAENIQNMDEGRYAHLAQFLESVSH